VKEFNCVKDCSINFSLISNVCFVMIITQDFCHLVSIARSFESLREVKLQDLYLTFKQQRA